MPKVVREEMSPQNLLLKIVIEKNDYAPKFNEELKKLQKQGSMKGFRKGNIPVSFLKKTYGKKIMNDAVVQLMQATFDEELNKEAGGMLGQPIMAEGSSIPNFDPNNLQDFEFVFEVGKAPIFEILGLDGGETLDFFTVTVPEEKIEEQVNSIRLQNGTRLSVDDSIQIKDIITLKSKELDNGEIKENGWETTFSIITDRLEAEAQEMLLTKKKGDVVRFNIFHLEKDAKPDYVKKYLLNFTKADLEEGTITNEEYEGIIEDVQRLLPGELTQELLENALGTTGDLATEAELRRRIREQLGLRDIVASNTLLFFDMQEKLMALNKPHIPLPEDFLARWLKSAHPQDASVMLKNRERFFDKIRWDLIKERLVKDYQLSVSKEEIVGHFHQKVWSYLGGMMQPGMETVVEQVVKKSLENKDEVTQAIDDLMTDKIFAAIKPRFQLNEVIVTKEELGLKLKAHQSVEDLEMAVSDDLAEEE